jgi:phospholipase C
MGWKDEIQHVVILMLENQSFDRLLGCLRLDDPAQRLDGLTGDVALPADLAAPGRLVPLPHGTDQALYVTDPNPGHQLDDISEQIFGRARPPAGATATMTGFLANYARQEGDDGRPIGAERAAAGLACLDPSLVPVISTLARSFVVCDRWFASAPGPTWPNRFFVHAATSNGYIDSPSNLAQLAGFLGTRFRFRTIFDSLGAAGRTWAVYFGDHAQAFGISSLHRYASDRFRRLEAFAAEVAAGSLPHYAFLEPQYMDVPGSPASDQHPPHHLMEGERLIAWVYDTLRSNPALWRRTLLLLLYDEHGGFYDHVPPPAAEPPDDASASADGFTFDRLGVRVPALVISPWARKGRADHRLYDHTSIPATLKGLFGLPAHLTRRDARANPLDDANFLDAPRALDDTPANLGALLTGRPRGAPRKSKLSDLQRSLLLLQELEGTPGRAARTEPQSP